MATPDLPEAAVGAAAGALWVTSVVDGSPSVGVNVRAALAAAAPHLRADERARVLDEVQAALRALAEHLLERDPTGVDFGDLVDGIRHAAHHLRDTVGAGGEG